MFAGGSRWATRWRRRGTLLFRRVCLAWLVVAVWCTGLRCVRGTTRSARFGGFGRTGGCGGVDWDLMEEVGSISVLFLYFFMLIVVVLWRFFPMVEAGLALVRRRTRFARLVARQILVIPILILMIAFIVIPRGVRFRIDAVRLLLMRRASRERRRSGAVARTRFTKVTLCLCFGLSAAATAICRSARMMTGARSFDFATFTLGATYIVRFALRRVGRGCVAGGWSDVLRLREVCWLARSHIGDGGGREVVRGRTSSVSLWRRCCGVGGEVSR